MNDEILFGNPNEKTHNQILTWRDVSCSCVQFVNGSCGEQSFNTSSSCDVTRTQTSTESNASKLRLSYIKGVMTIVRSRKWIFIPSDEFGFEKCIYCCFRRLPLCVNFLIKLKPFSVGFCFRRPTLLWWSKIIAQMAAHSEREREEKTLRAKHWLI